MAWLDLFRGSSSKAVGRGDVLAEIAARSSSRSGKAVTLDTAVTVSAVFACCRVLGNGMAQVPFKLMRETGKTRLPATDHRLYRLLARRPNVWQTSFEFRETLSWHVELFGQAYVFKNFAADRRILSLIPLEPQFMEVKQETNRDVRFIYRAPGMAVQEFTAAQIWHIKGPSWNGYAGIEMLRSAREAIGLAMSIEQSQASFHKNGINTSGAWSVEGKLTGPQHDDIVAWLAEVAGSANAGKPLILDRAAKWVSSQMTGVDAQVLETRKEQIAEVCRFFGVNPIMAGYTDKVSTYASAEQMFLAHAVHTLAPRWSRFEQSADAALLTDAEIEAGYYFDFVEEGMIRGSAKDTKDVLIGYVNGGLMTPNEGRAKLDLNPDADPESDKLRIPVNAVQPTAKPDEDAGATAGA